MQKLTEKEILVLIQIDEKIHQLREKQQEIIKKVVERHAGPSEGVLVLTEPDEDGKKYVRVRINDNLEKFTTGDPLWKSTAFSRYECEISRLKNEPK